MSWPPTLVDWQTLTSRLRDGDQVCVVHGRVAADQAPIGVPVCPRCRQLISIARRDAGGVLRCFAEPAPPRCGAPERHRLTGGTVLIGWTACMCPTTSPGPGGHIRWTCRACTDLGRTGDAATLSWPPHAD